MSVGRAFHTRGPTTDMALSANCSRFRLTTTLRRSLDSQELYEVLWGSKMSDFIHQGTRFEPNSALNWKPVELFQKRCYLCSRSLERCAAEKSYSGVLHTLRTVKCGLWAADEQTATVIQTWQNQYTYQRTQCVVINVATQLTNPSQVEETCLGSGVTRVFGVQGQKEWSVPPPPPKKK